MVTTLRCKRKTDGYLSEIQTFIETIISYIYNYWLKLCVNDALKVPVFLRRIHRTSLKPSSNPQD